MREMPTEYWIYEPNLIHNVTASDNGGLEGYVLFLTKPPKEEIENWIHVKVIDKTTDQMLRDELHRNDRRIGDGTARLDMSEVPRRTPERSERSRDDSIR